MLAEAEDSKPEAPVTSGRSSNNDAGSDGNNIAAQEGPEGEQPKKKAKTKIGNKSKKKKKLKTTSKFPEGPDGEQEHQDYCEVSFAAFI